MDSKNLTGYEIDTLPHAYNLTDGHAFRRWLPSEEAIIDRSAQLFRNNTRRHQFGIERQYFRDFSRLARQTFDESAFGYLMGFTASMSLEIVANYLRLNGLSLTLVEPCFDNLADIFRRHGVPMRPLPDWVMEAQVDDFERALEGVDTDVICLVTPNNPTGLTLTEENLRRLLDFCKARRKLLILDNCFRAYLPRDLVYDQYRQVIEADIDAVLVEDTGKTWPTSEIKAPFFAVTRSRGLYDRIYDIYTDFLLHVSPVGVRLLNDFIRLSEKDNLASIHEVVRVNRDALTENLAGTFLTACERPFASVAWLRINHPMTAQELKQLLDEHGVFVLPGGQFFWHCRDKGAQFIRVALVRDADVFREAVELLGKVCRKAASESVSLCKPSPGKDTHMGEICSTTNVRGEIGERGFAWIPRGAWSVCPSLQSHWQRLTDDWHSLEPDRFLAAGATFRRRRYGRFFWSPVEGLLEPLPNGSYFQPEEENSYAGGVVREFAPLRAETVANPWLRALIPAMFAYLPISDGRERATWEVRVHQIRIVATAVEPGLPAPEGVHQDGTDFLTLHLVRRHNVQGGVSTIYELDRRPIESFTLLEPLDSLILEDPRVMHGVTPIYPAAGQTEGSRDLLGLDFIYAPDLRRPEEAA